VGLFLSRKEAITAKQPNENLFAWIFLGAIRLIVIYNFGIYILVFLAICGAFLLANAMNDGNRRDRDHRDRW
jgi:hypothetical protein